MPEHSFRRAGLLGSIFTLAACGPTDQTPEPAGTKDIAEVEAHLRRELRLPANVQFAEMRTYVNSNMNIVCGRYERAIDDPAQPRGERFVVWGGHYNVDRMMAPGAMDQTIARYCRNESTSHVTIVGSSSDA